MTAARICFSREEKICLSMACWHAQNEFKDRLGKWAWMSKAERASYEAQLKHYEKLEKKLDGLHGLSGEAWGI